MASERAAAAEHHRLGEAGLMALGTLLMLESMRVFVSYLVFVLDQSRRTAIEGSVLTDVLAIALAWPLLKLLGSRRTLALAVGVLSLARLGAQLVTTPQARLVLGALGVAAWGWLAVTLVLVRRRSAALGLVLGLALDLGLRVVFHGVDLPWMPGPVSDAVTLVVLALFVLAAVRLVPELPVRPSAGPGPLGGLSLVAVGPGLAVFFLIAGNPGLAQVKTGYSFPGAAALLALGTGLGLAGAAVRLAARRLGLRLALIALAGGGLWLFWQGAALGSLGLVVGSAAALTLLAAAVDVPEQPARSPLRATTLWLTWGVLLGVAVLFAYYIYTGSPPAATVAVALLLLGTLPAGFERYAQPARTT